MLQGKQMACSASIRRQLVLLSPSCGARKQGQVEGQASNYIFSPYAYQEVGVSSVFTHRRHLPTGLKTPKEMDGFLGIRVRTTELSILSRDAEYPVYFRWP